MEGKFYFPYYLYRDIDMLPPTGPLYVINPPSRQLEPGKAVMATVEELAGTNAAGMDSCITDIIVHWQDLRRSSSRFLYETTRASHSPTPKSTGGRQTLVGNTITVATVFEAKQPRMRTVTQKYSRLRLPDMAAATHSELRIFT